MTTQMNLPDIGGDVVTVTEILVSVGDKITADQALLTVEGDKASMEIPAEYEGVVKEILVELGNEVKTGTPIFVIETESANTTEEKTPAPQIEKTLSDLVDIFVPDIGGDEVTVTEILVNVGDTVDLEQSLITVEGDKASMEVPATHQGIVRQIFVNLGDKVATGSLIMQFEVETSETASTPKEDVKPVEAPQEVKQEKAPAMPSIQQDVSQETVGNAVAYAHATPVVRRLAREFGVNLDKVTPTGRKGRILKEDVQAFVKAIMEKVEKGAFSQGSGLDLLPWSSVDFSKFGETEIQDLSRIKQISGKNLHRNWVQIPHVTQWDKADITSLESFRKEQNALLAKQKSDLKITPLVFIMKAVAKALEAFPLFNSALSEDGKSVILKKYINIGVAVDTPNGLVVPVIKEVNKKGILELSEELMSVSQKARSGKLTASDMQGGCFTISSLGGIGGTHFTPIINAPEVAILGVSRSEMQPVWNGESFEPRLMLPLSLSYDHRVIDGADGARFITYINQILVDLRRLAM